MLLTRGQVKGSLSSSQAYQAVMNPMGGGSFQGSFSLASAGQYTLTAALGSPAGPPFQIQQLQLTVGPGDVSLSQSSVTGMPKALTSGETPHMRTECCIMLCFRM